MIVFREVIEGKEKTYGPGDCPECGSSSKYIGSMRIEGGKYSYANVKCNGCGYNFPDEQGEM